MSKKVAVIGAGIGGLAAGCYARINGYEVEIFEMHSLPGGLCTAWQRKGYTFDGCIHWLMGTRPVARPEEFLYGGSVGFFFRRGSHGVDHRTVEYHAPVPG